MLIPEAGLDDNAIQYGTGKDNNRMSEFFTPEMPADPLMGVLPELIRKHPNAKRSIHPILSFTGIGVEDALAAQTIEEPLAPIGKLAEQNAIVLLIGVNLTVNTSIHWAERQAGRKQFTRWALTPQGVRECPGFPGCSDGFEMAAPFLNDITCSTRVGNATLHSIQLGPMIEVLTALMRQKTDALLCGKNDARCEAVRRSIPAENGIL
jgi:aminoglycoside 3-N-acetyltransferase